MFPITASRSLDDAVRILSESMDALPTVPAVSFMRISCRIIVFFINIVLYMTQLLLRFQVSVVFPKASVRLSSKLSQSSAAIVDHRPVTAEDLDDVLKGLAKFNMGTSRYADVVCFVYELLLKDKCSKGAVDICYCIVSLNALFISVQ